MTLIRQAISIFVLLTIVTGLAYPLAITGIAQVVFPRQANGSIIDRSGKPVGSSLIGQEFSDPALFWGRLSATGPVPYTAFNAEKLSGSSGSNLALSNPALLNNMKARIAALDAADKAAGLDRTTGQAPRSVPIDLITSSASGLDPHISPEAAEYQVPRIAKARQMSQQAVRVLVARHTSLRTFGLLGEPTVHVLNLNLELLASQAKR